MQSENPETFDNTLESSEYKSVVPEKTKKKLTPAQLANLERMRHKRSVKAEAKKIVETQLGTQMSPVQTNVMEETRGANAGVDYDSIRKKYEKDLDEVKQLKEYMKSYLEYKDTKSKMKKQKSVEYSNEEYYTQPQYTINPFRR